MKVIKVNFKEKRRETKYDLIRPYFDTFLVILLGISLLYILLINI